MNILSQRLKSTLLEFFCSLPKLHFYSDLRTLCALWQLQYVMQRDIEKEKKYFITCHYSSFILCVHFWVCLALAAIEAQKTKIQKWKTHKETQKMGLTQNNFWESLMIELTISKIICYFWPFFSKLCNISCHRHEEPQSSGIE